MTPCKTCPREISCTSKDCPDWYGWFCTCWASFQRQAAPVQHRKKLRKAVTYWKLERPGSNLRVEEYRLGR